MSEKLAQHERIEYARANNARIAAVDRLFNWMFHALWLILVVLAMLTKQDIGHTWPQDLTLAYYGFVAATATYFFARLISAIRKHDLQERRDYADVIAPQAAGAHQEIATALVPLLIKLADGASRSAAHVTKEQAYTDQRIRLMEAKKEMGKGEANGLTPEDWPDFVVQSDDWP